jgi:anti-sigma B factor antagonist
MERDERAPATGEQVNGHSNGDLVSRVASDDHVILAVAGEIDISSAEKFSDGVRALTAGENGEVVLDLRGCDFIDSTGLRALILLARELRARGQTLVLSGLNDGPRRVFEITGLLQGPDFEIREAATEMSVE